MRRRLVLGLGLFLGLFCASVSLDGLGESASSQPRPAHASGGLAGEPAPDTDLPGIVASPVVPVGGQAKLAVPPQRLLRPAEPVAVIAARARRQPARGIRPLTFPLLI